MNLTSLSLFLLVTIIAAAPRSKIDTSLPTDPENIDDNLMPNVWPLGRDPTQAELDQQARLDKIRSGFKDPRYKARAEAGQEIITMPTVFQDPPVETRPLGYELIMNAGDQVKKIRRELNNYAKKHAKASEEEWMINFLDLMQSIDKEDNHILTDRLFTILKEKRTHH